jgi:hypothetical protein
MGVDLNANGVVMEDWNADTADVKKQGLLSIGYDVADWRENIARFFRNHFAGNEAKQTILVMAQCVDLRLFVVSSHVPFPSIDAYLKARVSPYHPHIHTLMVEKGMINMDGFLCVGVNARHWQTQCTKMLFLAM